MLPLQTCRVTRCPHCFSARSVTVLQFVTDSSLLQCLTTVKQLEKLLNGRVENNRKQAVEMPVKASKKSRTMVAVQAPNSVVQSVFGAGAPYIG
jgi:hypothetical protein